MHLADHWKGPMSDATNLNEISTSTGDPPRPLTVLYVEDNASNLALVEELFARRGNLKLISVTDGLEGVNLAISLQPAIIAKYCYCAYTGYCAVFQCLSNSNCKRA
jgi:hypothetical protein